MGKDVTKKQAEFMKSVYKKNCDDFRRLMRRPEFMAEVGTIQKTWELPIVLEDAPRHPNLRLCLTLIVFRLEKLSELALNYYHTHGDTSKLDPAKIFSILLPFWEKEMCTLLPSEAGELPDVLARPTSGWSDMPPSGVFVSGIQFFLKNWKPIVAAFSGQRPLPEEIAKEPSRLGFSIPNKQFWKSLCEGQPPGEKMLPLHSRINKINATKEELVGALFVYAGSQMLDKFFREDIRNLVDRFGLTPNWLWPLYVFMVTGISPIEVGCIPRLNVGISNRSRKDKFSFDPGKKTTDRDLELALQMMRKFGSKTAYRNYPDKNLEANLEIDELSRKKPNVRRQIQKAREEAKKKARKRGVTFDPDDDEYVDYIGDPPNDAGIGERVFPNSDATDRQLAERVKHRRKRLKESQEKRFST